MIKTKKLALILIAVVILHIFTACEENDAPIQITGTPEAGETTGITGENEVLSTDSPLDNKPETGDYYFIYKDYYILLNDDYERVAAKIGKANDTFEIPSCAFEGIDKMFYYDGFYITTYPAGEKDFIISITLTGENIKTPEGVGPGMGFDDMIKAYGDDYRKNFDLYSYEKGDVELAFLFENDMVADINYYFLPAAG